MGEDNVLQAYVSDVRLNIEYRDGWQEYLQCEGWSAMIKKAEDKLNQRSEKGKGKGKGKVINKGNGGSKGKGKASK